MKKITFVIIVALLVGLFTSCKEDALDPHTIFDTTPPVRNEFEQWLYKNYLESYNIDFKYRMEDIESDFRYNLSPAKEAFSVDLAKQAKFLWFDAYDEITGSQEFMREHAPRMIHLIGSPAYNPSSRSEVLGTAEGGLKITLYNVNNLDKMTFKQKNFYYYHTLHHEFGHILHQKINYPKEFELISMGNYTSADWLNKSNEEAYCKGFVSSYGSSEPREDFVEFIAYYVTNDAKYWENLLVMADSTYEVITSRGKKVINPEGLKGSVVINQKLDLIKGYLSKYWHIDLDQLREVVQRRTGSLEELAVRSTIIPYRPDLDLVRDEPPCVEEHLSNYWGYRCFNHSSVINKK